MAEITLIHSSDLHIDDDYTARLHDGDGTAGLGAVLHAAREHAADLIVLAGDIFERNRLPDPLIARVGEMIDSCGIDTVILPGNHDPCVPGSAHHRLVAGRPRHVRVIGVHEEAVYFSELDLTVFGKPHRDYSDMVPIPEAHAHAGRWHVMLAHAHFMETPDRSLRYRPSWLIGAEDIARSGAHYVGLGHWNSFARVEAGAVPACYSGSPETAGTVNRVRLSDAGPALVDRIPVTVGAAAVQGRPA